MDEIRDIDSKEFFNLSSGEEKIKFLLRYAILAPSTHNSQPWLFKIENNSCKIYYDPSKKITEADPLGRDLYISFGCLLENLIIAASYFNVFNRVDYYSGRTDNLIAEVFFSGLSKKTGVNRNLEKILEVIPKRVNARGIFEDQEISEEILKEIVALNDFSELKLDLIQDKEKIKRLAELTARGLKIAYESKSFRKEMASWMHSSFSKKREGIPGYSLRLPALISLIFPSLVRFFNLGKAVSILNYKSIASAPLVCVISAKENSPLIWLKVGRLFERITLELTALNLKTSIFVAAIEIGDLYKQAQEVLGHKLIPQLLFCVGYMNFKQKPNLRHPVESKLIS